MYMKKNKYHNKKTKIGDTEFHSKKEAERFKELQIMQRAGLIRELSTQVKFVLIPAQYEKGRCIERQCSYIADFTYRTKDGNFVVEDTKGEKTKDYIIKRKLMLQKYGIKVLET